jgi:hypothetical protein
VNGFDGVIKQLEAQRAAIEKALTALQEIEGIAAPKTSVAPVSTANDRRSAAQKARWAAKRAVEAAPTAPVAKRKGISAAGRKKLAEAMKRRWALKRTAAQAKRSLGRPKKVS